MLDIGLQKCVINPYLLTRGSLFVVAHIDDCEISSKNNKEIEKWIHSLKHIMDVITGKKVDKLKCFNFTDNSGVKTF